MTNVALSHDLSVVSGHFQELSDSHAAFVAVLAAANRDNAIGNFLLSHNEEIRHLLEFALANLVAELLTPTASAATPRSCQPASGLPRHSACTLFLHEGAEVGHFVCWSYGRSPHYRVGRAILQGHPCAP